ncbi:hypothetical protein DICPUDRAFT_84229 [Dictyostelium purpureum]|uniref:DUF6787 domain-containing protein n=1 Tax=Dictyostelium purpureum TaxID=5786 RepID=F1A1Z6_DICPU|nr:uncharacterized protein DICPUDRAFT_84229 [Dictyostelium purpureum]EGC29786.1 hypothetical protein DICPUDRAFT_84229 [Dictyostelium purpureum]|eukprot:XP_003293694.1 hypothetical protein DICPUDRAFT_84229 [Dictyostelium purpureum]
MNNLNKFLTPLKNFHKLSHTKTFNSHNNCYRFISSNQINTKCYSNYNNSINRYFTSNNNNNNNNNNNINNTTKVNESIIKEKIETIDDTIKETEIKMNNKKNNEDNKTLIDKYLKNIYEYPRFSSKWWLEKSYIFAIFGVTGTSSLYVVKFLLKYIFGYPNPSSLVSIITGSVPMDVKYSIIYFLTMYTVYPFILLTYGTLFGRYQYFVKFFNRMSVFSQIKRVYLRLTNKNIKKK